MSEQLKVEVVRATKTRVDLVAMAEGLGIAIQDHHSNDRIRKAIIRQVSDGPRAHGKQHETMARIRRSASDDRVARAQVVGNTRGTR